MNIQEISEVVPEKNKTYSFYIKNKGSDNYSIRTFRYLGESADKGGYLFVVDGKGVSRPITKKYFNLLMKFRQAPND